ncbi:Nuclear Hormone Receptor family [Caenorhabditis elegans]|uniref:Nuclear Hormone Receptor family n=1 Tax=Caenorhabditis elegans TaxID=6239 RepID=A0A131MCM3_CAEEL|nr:Nuclear Hormone Receptor family [Caenorhabditis elegans]CZR14591.1 Nuclear Hormone Receptor family [Caenorhabditis elegans]|eukprot:NP_001309666.1 Nuclear Hormone Receptor family [Caenorhabditis elegans]
MKCHIIEDCKNTRNFTKILKPSKCMVCARPAHGYHCDVTTCKGCKSFFRRMYLLRSEIKCSGRNDCFDLKKRIEPLLRCRSCRYRKCLLVGMNPEALVFNMLTKEDSIIKVINSLDYLDQKVEKFRLCAYNPDWATMGGLADLIKNNGKLNQVDKYGPFPGWPLDPDHEFAHQNFYRDLKAFSTDRKEWRLFNLLASIEYSKTFLFFQNLDLPDQLRVLKHTAAGCSSLSCSFFTLRQKYEDIRQPDGTQRPSKLAPGYALFSALIGPMRRVGTQYFEYLLLKALYLCNPAIPGLTVQAQHVLERERRLYSNILMEFCLRNYSNGATKFVDVIQLIGVLEWQQKNLKDLHVLLLTPVLSQLPGDFCVSFVHELVFD